MIEYQPGRWQISFVFTCKGSVFPRALAWALPATILSCILHQWVLPQNTEMSMSQLASYNFVLGFLVVFRSQQAYSRFWEGATIVQQVRGEWFNAVSSCFAFCTSDENKQQDVEHFQHLLIRLASLLYCTALQQIAVLEDESFEIIDLEGLGEESLEYLASAPEKCLVILQWMQNLIVRNCEQGVVSAPAPVVSRIYQELSRGIVNIVNAQKITDIIFPFPYAQMVAVMLMISSVVTPVVMAIIMEDIMWCATLTFISVFSYWSINYIAAEIEMPFGEDANDLPVARLQESFNSALTMLMEHGCKKPPDFIMSDWQRSCATVPCPFFLITDVQHRVFGEGSVKDQRITESGLRAVEAFRASRYSSHVGSNTSIRTSTIQKVMVEFTEEAEEALKLGKAGGGRYRRPSTSSLASDQTPDNHARRWSKLSTTYGQLESSQGKSSSQNSLSASDIGGSKPSTMYGHLESSQGNSSSQNLLTALDIGGGIICDLPDTCQEEPDASHNRQVLEASGEINGSVHSLFGKTDDYVALKSVGPVDQMLAALTSRIESHFSQIVADLGRIAAHRAGSTPIVREGPKSDLSVVKLTACMEEYFSWLAKELSCISTAGPLPQAPVEERKQTAIPGFHANGGVAIYGDEARHATQQTSLGSDQTRLVPSLLQEL